MLRLDDPRWPDLNHRGWSAGRASSYDPGAPFVPGELRHLLTFSRNRERGMNFQGVISKARWSPRSVFPPSRMVSSRIFACGEGLYLLTNPNLGEGDPVRAVGWAESDYWANRVWETPFSGRLDAPGAQWGGPPSLRFLGRPEVLSFASVLDFEKAQPGARKATVLVAEYRVSDGAFLHHVINGTDGITYFYASDEPLPEDLPVGLEIRLPEHQ